MTNQKRTAPAWIQRAALPTLALALAMLGATLRLAHPDRAAPWYDEFRTLLHASGHSQEDLNCLLEEREPISAREIQNRFLAPSSRGPASDLAVAMRSDLQVSPLYYGLVRLTLRPGVAPLSGARKVAALLSVATLPAFFAVCLQLFRNWTIAWIGLAIVSVSPTLVYWAFEARPYSLWSFGILVSTAALLHAAHVRSVMAWSFYATSTAVMLWSHLLSLLVLAVQSGYVLLFLREQRGRYGLATLGALLAASPWLVTCAVFWQGRISQHLGWLRNARTPQYFDHISYAIGHGIWVSLDGFGGHSGHLTMFAAFLFEGVAVYALWRRGTTEQRFLVFALLAIVAVPLAAMDACLGGVRLSNVRYLIPSTLAVVLAVAWHIGLHPTLPKSALLVALLGLETYSSLGAASSQLPEGKWRTEKVTLPYFKAALESRGVPLVVSFGQVELPTALSMVLRPDIKFLFLRSVADWEHANALRSKHDLFLLESSQIHWYYEPHQRRANALFASIAPQLALHPVVRGLFWVAPDPVSPLR